MVRNDFAGSSRGVKKLNRPLTLEDSYVYAASADTDLRRRGRAGTAVSFAQTGHADHFAARHLELVRRYYEIRLTRHRMSVMVESVLTRSLPFTQFNAPMAFILQPWQLLVTILTAFVNHYQQQVNDFQRVQIEALLISQGKKRILFNDDQRCVLAIKAKALGRKALGTP